MLRAVSSIPLYLGSFTYATLPAAASYSGMEAFASDWGANGTKVRSNGTRWLPVGGRVLHKHLGAAVTGVANTATIVLQTPLMPVGSAQAGDAFYLDITGLTKSGTTDNLNVTAYCGTAGTTSDASLITTNTPLAAASQSGGVLYVLKVIDNTHIQRIGPISSNGEYAVAAASALNAAVVVSDLSANAEYLSVAIASSGTTNTVAISDGAIWQIVN